MPAPIIVSRVRATLHRQGHQGFTQEQILNAANAMNIDVNNPTSEDTKAVVDSLKKLSTPTDITVSEPISVPTNESESVQTNNNSESSIAEINKEQLNSLPTEKYEMVSHSQKMSLISEVSQKLNVQLSESQALEIASQISKDITDFKDIIAEIKQAIQLFIAYEIEQTQQDFDVFANELLTQYSSEVARVNSHMTTISNDVKVVLEVAKQARKSRTQDYLKQFSVPSTKA